MIYKKDTQKTTSRFVLWLTKAVDRIAIVSIVLLIGIGAAIVFGGNYMDLKLQNHRDAAEIREATLSLLATSQEMRRREKDFFLRKDFVYSDKYYQLSDTAMRLADKMKEMVEAEKYYKLIRALDGSLQAHNQQFGLALLSLQNLGMTEEKGLNGELKQTTISITQALDAEKASPQIQALWLELQLETERSIHDGAMEDKRSIPRLYTQLKEAFAVKHPTLVQPLNKYLLQFNNIMLQTKSLVEETAKLTTIFHDFEVGIDNLVDITAVASRNTYEDVKTSLYYWKLSINLLAVFTALLIGLIAILIVRKIAMHAKID